MLHLKMCPLTRLLKTTVMTLVAFHTIFTRDCNLWKQQVLQDTPAMNMYGIIKNINKTAPEIYNTEFLNMFRFLF